MTKYKKFILMQWYDYYPAGGLGNIVDSFDTLEDAKRNAEENDEPKDNVAVYDRDTWECIWRQ